MVAVRSEAGPGLTDRLAIWCLISIALLIEAAVAWAAWVSLREKLVDGLYTFTFTLAGTPRSVPFPEPPGAVIERITRSNEVTATLRDVSAGLAGLVTLQHVLGVLLSVVIVGGFVMLLLRVLRGKPFVRTMTVLLSVMAITLLVAGTASEVLANLVTSVAQEELTGGRPDTPLGATWTWTFSGTWVFIGLALAAVAGAFQLGERLQRDNEGLV